MNPTLTTLAGYIDAAIKEDHFLGILFTSQAEGSIKSELWGYGVGKSTLALNFMKTFIYGGNFEEVKRHIVGFAYQLRPFLEEASPTRGVLWEDMQIDVGKHRAHDVDVQELAIQLTIERPHLKVLMGTVPHRGILQKDFREELFHFEVIVPSRGTYEIQRLKRWIPYRDPLRIKERCEAFGAGVFMRLTREEQKWYEQWRNWRDTEARKRVKLLRPPTSEEPPRPPTAAEFCEYARSIGLKGDQIKFQKLWQRACPVA